MAPRPFIPAPKVASVEFIYAMGTVVCENRVHALAASDFDESMVAALWDASKAWWIANIKTHVGGALSFNRLKVKAQHSDTAPVLDTAILPVQNGSFTGIMLPNNASFALKLTTGLAGRSARGRWYWAGLTTDHVTNSVSLNAPSASAFVAALSALESAYGAIGMTPCIVSYRHNKAWRAEGVPYPVIGVSYTDTSLDSQRRRLLGRGR